MSYAKQLKKVCVCGTAFYKISGQIKPFHPYCSPACAMKHKTGRVDNSDLMKVPLPILKQMAVGVFQDWVKKRDFGKPCYTCNGTKGPFHAGHGFKKELFSGMIFNETACKIQCEFCNCGGDGETPVFMTKLQAELKIEKFIELENEAITTKSYRWSKIEYIEKIEYYNGKIAELEARNNVSLPVYDVKPN